MRGDQYNYGAIYTEDVCDTPLAPYIKTAQKTVSTKAGPLMEIKSFPSFLNRQDYTRAKKYKPSRKVQQKLNDTNARKKAVLKIHANFGAGDLWFTAGWTNQEMPATADDARKILADKFIRPVNVARKKQGKDNLRYFYVIEETAGDPKKGEPENKYHVHVVISGDNDRDWLENMWPGGEYPEAHRIRSKEIGAIVGLSLYIQECPMGRRRWGCSKGLKPYSHKPTESYSKFSASCIHKIAALLQTGEHVKVKDIMEKTYPGYAYDLEYPAEVRKNEDFGGLYLFCRMYRKAGASEQNPASGRSR
ncbi:MAG: hypothetical protein VB035_10020 [Candidatus Fimivivens sp.]|nr:hypothetical protein [Candidatus Fimivivens sp.]